MFKEFYAWNFSSVLWKQGGCIIWNRVSQGGQWLQFQCGGMLWVRARPATSSCHVYKLDLKSFRTWNSTKLNWRGYGTLKQTPSLTFRFMIPGMMKYDITSFSSKIKLWWKQAKPVPRHKTSFPLTSRQNLTTSPVQKGTKIENPLSPWYKHPIFELLFLGNP